MNHIEKHREKIRTVFDEKTFEMGDCESFLSPTNNYQLETANFFLKNTPWDFTRMRIYQQGSGELLFDFFVNESRLFFEWLTAG